MRIVEKIKVFQISADKISMRQGEPNMKNSDNNYIPSDYGDLYIHYVIGNDSLAANLIRHFVPFATQEDREDLLQGVIERCMEKGVLDHFDPTKANFGGVIYFVTRTICCNWLDRRSRNPITGLNAGVLVETQDEFEPGAYSLESMFGTVDMSGVDARMDAAAIISKIERFVESCSARSSNKRDRSMEPMLGMLFLGYNVKEIAKELTVTTSTVYSWMELLKLVAEGV